jgi:MipA family protein
MRLKRLVPLCLAALVTLPARAHAQATRPPDWSVTVGGGAIVGPRFRYLGSEETQALPFPYIDARWRDRVFVSAVEGVGVNLIATDVLHAGAALYPDLGRKESDGALLRGMGDVGSTAEARAFVRYSGLPVTLDAKIHRRLGAGQGGLAELGTSYGWLVSSRLGLLVGASLTWMDDAYAKTFFGVSSVQAARSGLSVYQAGAGLRDVAATLGYQVDLGGPWGLLGRVRVSRLVSDAAASPVVAQKTQPSFGGFLTYRLR